MNCELCRAEMYSWRPDSEVESFQLLFDHLDKCSECARLFDRLVAKDEAVRRTFEKVPESPLLESRILAGLAHQRSQREGRRTFWRSWFLVPLAASILLIGTVSYSPIRQEQLLGRDLSALLSKPPALQIISSDRSELLRWSTAVLPGADVLPAQLDRVEFGGASAVSVADHKAVFLRMKNEQRASLLIVDARLTNHTGIKSMYEKTGSAALWSDEKKSYVLLFDGNMEEMRAYMEKMGIST
jgi:hypothetical protein